MEGVGPKDIRRRMAEVTPQIAAGTERADRIALIALFVGAVAIAFAPIFVRLSEVGPSATAFYRFAFACLPMLQYAMPIRRQAIAWRGLRFTAFCSSAIAPGVSLRAIRVLALA